MGKKFQNLNIKSQNSAQRKRTITVKDVFEEEESHLQEIAWKIFKKEFGKQLPRVIKAQFENVLKEK